MQVATAHIISLCTTCAFAWRPWAAPAPNPVASGPSLPLPGDKQRLFRLIKKVSAAPDPAPASPRAAVAQQQQRAGLRDAPSRLGVAGHAGDLLDLGGEDDMLTDYAAGVDLAASPRTLLGHVTTMKAPRPSAGAAHHASPCLLEATDPNPAKIRVVVRKRPVNAKVCAPAAAAGQARWQRYYHAAAQMRFEADVRGQGSQHFRRWLPPACIWPPPLAQAPAPRGHRIGP